MENQTNINFPIFEEDGVHVYFDEDGTAHIRVEDAAIGLGFTQVKNGVEYIRWETMNRYLAEFDFPNFLKKMPNELGNFPNWLGKIPNKLGKGDYIPEQLVYFFAMKANNETARFFQFRVAFKILPSLRKNGYYYLNKPIAPVVTKPKKNPRHVAGQKAHASVYIFRLPDGNVCIVKIGQSKDVETRKKQIEKLYNVTITTYYKTCELPRKVARAFEQACHKIFAPFKVKGELFAVEYETALRIVAAVEDMLRALPILFDEERAEIILSIADTLGVVPERKALLVEAANIIAGKELVGVVGDIFLPASK